MLPLPLGCPSADQLRICWPRNRPFEEEVVLGGIPGSSAPIAAIMDELLAIVGFGLPVVPHGGAHSLLLHDLGMDAPYGLAPLAVALAPVAPADNVTDTSANDLPEESTSWIPTRRLLSKTSFRSSWT